MQLLSIQVMTTIFIFECLRASAEMHIPGTKNAADSDEILNVFNHPNFGPILELFDSFDKEKIQKDDELSDIFFKLALTAIYNVKNPNFDINEFRKLTSYVDGAPYFENLK